ncbi:MAG: transcription-repair coupling factor [Candidatus Omnitrophota bacterium]
MVFLTIKLAKGNTVSVEDILSELVHFGYSRIDPVSQQGEFNIKGGQLEIFPIGFQSPVRVELTFNDVIETIRSFDLFTKKFTAHFNSVIILPFKKIKPIKVKDTVMLPEYKSLLKDFSDLEAGDYIVHDECGIGIYRGIEKIRINKKPVDHLVIEYAKGEKLYVSWDKLDLVHKYIGFEGSPPKLYKLGSKLWRKVKSEAKKGVNYLALELLHMQAAREALEGFRFSPDTDWQKEFERSFKFQETPGQAKATVDVKRDMESKRPMDRLLCGDVGYGKTEVALRAAFKAVMDNKQVAFLVPTTILALQHYTTFKERIVEYPIRVEMLSRFKTKQEQYNIVNDLKAGAVDIIIGTHRLLSDDIGFKNLGLVIIDEEQRFGVEHKERLKKFRLLVDVLTLTATPIPRTLYMSLMNVKDISIIDTPPENRLPVYTHVGEFDHALIKNAIRQELKRKGQVYVVHNEIVSIEKIKKNLTNLLPSATIGLAHGRMSERALKSIMPDFVHKKFDILLSTTIIESGIDIPNVNTIIVNNAHTYGLSDLYQLRGRVGRFNRKAFAYFFTPRSLPLTGDVKKRLTAIEKYTELGAGFKIAMADLQLRGAGNMLGKEQHGFIASVGFDLYLRLLRESVEKNKTFFKKVDAA